MTSEPTDLDLPAPWRPVTDPAECRTLEQAVAQVTAPRHLLHGHSIQVVAANDDSELLLRLDNGWLGQVDRRAGSWRVRAMFETASAWRAAWLEEQRFAERNAVWHAGTPEVRAEIRRRLIALIAEVTARGREILNTTRLYHDLHLAGDDAAELLEHVHLEFGTLFYGMQFDRHFPGETEALPLHVARLFGYKARRFTPIALGHLIAVVERGQWFEPDAPRPTNSGTPFSSLAPTCFARRNRRRHGARRPVRQYLRNGRSSSAHSTTC